MKHTRDLATTRLLVLVTAMIAATAMTAMTAGCAGERPVADVAFTNGKIYTVDGRSRWVEAVAVKDGRFIMVGDAVDVGEVTGESTRVVDLDGQFVMPAMVDGESVETSPGDVTRHLAAIAAAVNVPDASVSLGEAIADHTRNAAADLGAGAERGSIEIGKRADMIMLDRNPFQMPRDAIATVVLQQAFTAGEVAYTRDPS